MSVTYRKCRWCRSCSARAGRRASPQRSSHSRASAAPPSAPSDTDSSRFDDRFLPPTNTHAHNAGLTLATAHDSYLTLITASLYLTK